MLASTSLCLALLPCITGFQEPNQPYVPLAKQAKMVFDPKNGYLDYVAAADSIYSSKRPNPAALLNETERRETFLEISRKVRSEYGGVYDMITRGNRKGSWVPHDSISYDTLFPELAQFREIARALSSVAYAHLAEGNSSLAANVIREGLVFSDNISRGTLIHMLVGSATSAILLAALDDLLLAMPARDGLALAESVTQILSLEPSVSIAMEWEHRGMEIILLKDLDRIGGVKGLFEQWSLGGGSNELDPLAREFQNYSPEQIKGVINQVLARAKTRLAQYKAMFRKPESEWRSLDTTDEPTNVVEWFEEQVSGVYGQAIEVAVIRRTQLRLLRLHVAISAFFWEHRRLPGGLEELPQSDWVLDPYSGGKFIYEVSGRKDYRLYAKGTKRGEIDLKLKPRTSEVPTGNEPPHQSQKARSLGHESTP